MPHEPLDKIEWEQRDHKVISGWVDAPQFEHILNDSEAQAEIEAYFLARRAADPRIDLLRLRARPDGAKFLELEWASKDKAVGWWPPQVAARVGRP
jgi:hypothetical protein